MVRHHHHRVATLHHHRNNYLQRELRIPPHRLQLVPVEIVAVWTASPKEVTAAVLQAHRAVRNRSPHPKKHLSPLRKPRRSRREVQEAIHNRSLHPKRHSLLRKLRTSRQEAQEVMRNRSLHHKKHPLPLRKLRRNRREALQMGLQLSPQTRLSNSHHHQNQK